jgi:precorrin-6B methylase 1
MMKRYLIGLALTGLGARLTKRARAVVPQRRQAMPANVAGLLIAAGIGAGLARWLTKK